MSNIRDYNGLVHVWNNDFSPCGERTSDMWGITESELTCPKCAEFQMELDEDAEAVNAHMRD